MRKEFEMTDEELKELLDACRPVHYLVVGGVIPRSPQENANDAWQRLGNKRGFRFSTVRPVAGKGMKFFTAEVEE